MTHAEIIEKINEEPFEKRHRGIAFSEIETIKQILIEKGITSEGEYTRHLDENLKRNFSLKD